jgi:hypothetical protein
MDTWEIYFWLLVPVYVVGALTISNWLASLLDFRYRLLKEKIIRKKDNI